MNRSAAISLFVTAVLIFGVTRNTLADRQKMFLRVIETIRLADGKDLKILTMVGPGSVQRATAVDGEKTSYFNSIEREEAEEVTANGNRAMERLKVEELKSDLEKLERETDLTRASSMQIDNNAAPRDDPVLFWLSLGTFVLGLCFNISGIRAIYRRWRSRKRFSPKHKDLNMRGAG